MAARDEAIDQRLVLGGEAIVERVQSNRPIAASVRGPAITALTNEEFSTHDTANCPAVMPLASAWLLDLLRELQRFRAPFGLHHARVVAPGAGVLVGRGIGAVFAGQHAARQRAVGHDAEAVIAAGRKVLDLGHAVHRVVIGLADDRAVDAEPVADVADLGDTPGAVVRDAEIAHLAVADQIAHRAHGLVQRRRVVFLVQVIDVDVVGAEPLQALFRRLQHPAPRQPAVIGIVADRVGEFGRQHPVLPVVGNRAADHLLGVAAVVGIRRVDEVDAGLARLGDDPRRGRLVGRPAEHHGAQADRRNLQAAAAELAVLHRATPTTYTVIPGWRVSTRPGISRFRVRCFASPRNDGV